VGHRRSSRPGPSPVPVTPSWRSGDHPGQSEQPHRAVVRPCGWTPASIAKARRIAVTDRFRPACRRGGRSVSPALADRTVLPLAQGHLGGCCSPWAESAGGGDHPVGWRRSWRCWRCCRPTPPRSHHRHRWEVTLRRNDRLVVLRGRLTVLTRQHWHKTRGYALRRWWMVRTRAANARVRLVAVGVGIDRRAGRWRTPPRPGAGQRDAGAVVGVRTRGRDPGADRDQRRPTAAGSRRRVSDLGRALPAGSGRRARLSRLPRFVDQPAGSGARFVAFVTSEQAVCRDALPE